jgi:hypothetical protein
MSGLPTPQKPRTIKLQTQRERCERIAANGSIYPGHLLAVNSSNQVAPHATVGGPASRWFAEEEGLYSLNSGTPNSVDTQYASGALIPIFIAHPGDLVNAILKAGVAYAVGDQLISAGDGTLEKASSHTSGSTFHTIIGECDVALDLSATGAVNTRSAVFVY